MRREISNIGLNIFSIRYFLLSKSIAFFLLLKNLKTNFKTFIANKMETKDLLGEPGVADLLKKIEYAAEESAKPVVAEIEQFVSTLSIGKESILFTIVCELQGFAAANWGEAIACTCEEVSKTLRTQLSKKKIGKNWNWNTLLSFPVNKKAFSKLLVHCSFRNCARKFEHPKVIF